MNLDSGHGRHGLPRGWIVVLAATAGACEPPGEAFKSSVYIQDGTTSGVVVALAWPRPDTVCVTWSQDPLGSGEDVDRICETVPTKLHAIELTDLHPDALYFYRLESAEGDTIGESVFRTAAIAGTRPVTFAVVTDTGQVDPDQGTAQDFFEELIDNDEPPGRQGKVVRAVVASDPPPEFVLHCGDVLQVNHGREFYHRAFFRPFAPLIDHVPIFPVQGNHDSDANGSRAWMDAFTTPANNPQGDERYYSFEWGDVHFVALDVVSVPFGPGSAELDFLESDLAASAAPWKVVYFHKPPFSGGRHGDNEDIIRDLVPVFEERGVALVLSGHEHVYQRMRPVAGVTYIVVGSGGGSLEGRELRRSDRLAFGAKRFMFLRVQADATSMKIEAVGTDQDVFDSVTLTR